MTAQHLLSSLKGQALTAIVVPVAADATYNRVQLSTRAA
jgi:hypothetical protein